MLNWNTTGSALIISVGAVNIKMNAINPIDAGSASHDTISGAARHEIKDIMTRFIALTLS